MNLGKVICGLLGHPAVVDESMGRIFCHRCGELLVDTLTQAVNPAWEKSLVYKTGMSLAAGEAWYHKEMNKLLKLKGA